MVKVMVELPASYKVSVGKDGALVNEINLAAIADKFPKLIAIAAIKGFEKAVNDISRGKDENGKADSDVMWQAARAKKIDQWEKEGVWAQAGGRGGETFLTRLKEQFISEQVAKGASKKQVEDFMREAVKAEFGEGEAFGFGKFLDVVAMREARADGHEIGGDDYLAIRERLENNLAEREAAERAKREKAAVTLDLSSIVI